MQREYQSESPQEWQAFPHDDAEQSWIYSQPPSDAGWSAEGEAEESLWVSSHLPDDSDVIEISEWQEHSALLSSSYIDDDEDDFYDDEDTDGDLYHDGYARTERHHSETTRLGRFVFTVGVSLCLVTLLGVALTQIWAYSEARRVGFTIGKLAKQQEQIIEQRRELRLQLAKLQSPSRHQRIARYQLSLRKPTRAQLIRKEQLRGINQRDFRRVAMKVKR